MIKYSAIGMALAWTLASIFSDQRTMLYLFTIFTPFIISVYSLSYMSAMFSRARDLAKHDAPFVVMREVALNIGRITMLTTAIIIVHLTGELQGVFLFIATASLVILFIRLNGDKKLIHDQNL